MRLHAGRNPGRMWLLGVVGLLSISAAGQVARDAPEAVPEWQTAAGGKMAFDVVSIHPSQPGTFSPPNFPLSPDDAYAQTGGLMKADFPLATFIEFAYKQWFSREQRSAVLAHLPSWVGTESFTIQARVAGNPTKDQMRLMAQTMLADRFKLQVHFESREVPVFALTLIKPGRTGPKLQAYADGPSCDEMQDGQVFPQRCGAFMMKPTTGSMHMIGARDTTIDQLAACFSSVTPLGRPAVDRTGLIGKYDFTLEWVPDPSAGKEPEADAQGPTFLQAVREQLGMKLEPAKAPVKVLVVDHVELPSEN